MKVSLIATVRNEYRSLPSWFEAITMQSMLPDECIIVDGGSTDGTLEYLRALKVPFSLRILNAPGANISAGRNLGIEAATGDVIAVTDAGTRADSTWLESIVEPFASGPETDVVAGFFVPETQTFWSESLAAATLPDVDEVDDRRFLPSSRSIAFRRRWYAAGFQYPEWLDYCEDLVFDLQLRRAGARQRAALDAIVRFEPRRSATAFFVQYFRYARGDGKAGLFGQRHIIRYLTYVVASLVIVRRRPAEYGALAVGVSLNLRKPVRRIWCRSVARQRWTLRATGLVCLAAFQVGLGDIAKMIGYPAGLYWRVRRDRSFKLWKTRWVNRGASGDLTFP